MLDTYVRYHDPMNLMNCEFALPLQEQVRAQLFCSLVVVRPVLSSLSYEGVVFEFRRAGLTSHPSYLRSLSFLTPYDDSSDRSSYDREEDRAPVSKTYVRDLEDTNTHVGAFTGGTFSMF